MAEQPKQDPVFDPIGALFAPFNPQTFARDADPISVPNMHRLVGWMQDQGWSDEEIDWVMRNGPNAGASHEAVLGLIEKQREWREAQAIDAQAQEAYDKYVAGVNQTVTQGQERIGEAQTRTAKNIKRYDDILAPGGMRNDEDYGVALAAAENYLNSAANRTRREAASATSQSGISGSGRAADAVMRSEHAAGVGKEQAYAKLSADAKSRQTAYEEYLDVLNDKETALSKYRDQINAGGMPAALTMGNFRLDAMPQFDPLNDLLGVKLGQEQSQHGMAQGNVGMLANVFSGLGDQMQTGFQSVVGGIRGG